MGWGAIATPRLLYLWERDVVHIVLGQSGRVWKISPLAGFEPQSVQPHRELY